MKAWQVTGYGEPAEAMKLVDVPMPEPGPGQVLVKVRGAALNFPDVLLARGQYQIRPPLPFTAGVELCGTVADTSERIIGTPVIPHGALAEYTLVERDQVYPAPDALDDAQAAALFIAYQTGWFGLHRRARIQAGETLLVHAAAGGVGSAAVQLGKAAGARVLAVTGGAAKGEVARALGADVVIDRTRDDVIAAVKEATGGRGADVVYDPVGGEAFTSSTKCVAFEGRIIVVGFAGGTIPAPPLSHALVKNYSILGLHWGLYRQRDPEAISECHQRLTGMADAGTISPLIGGRLTMDEAVDGLTRLGAGESTGRLVVLP
jgi:NADPH:quinone reductase